MRIALCSISTTSGWCRLLRATLGFGVAIVSCVQVTSATPIAPNLADLQHGWLFDEVDVNGYVPDLTVGESAVRLTSNRVAYTYPEATPSNREVPLVAEGDLVKTGVDTGNLLNTLRPVTNATPFAYTGNHAGINDWWNGTQSTSYPAATGIDGRRPIMGLMSDIAKNQTGVTTGDNMILKASGGAVSFWINPIGHETSGTVNVNPDRLFLFQAIGGSSATASASTSNSFGIGKVSQGFSSANGIGRSTSTFSYSSASNPNSEAGPDGTYGSWGLKNPNTAQYNGLPTDTWTNIIATWGDGKLDLYIDGAKVIDNLSFNFRGDLYVRNFGFGFMNNTGAGPDQPAPALYDELSIWNKRLAADEVSWLAGNSLNALFNPMPEPSSAALLAMGLMWLARFRRRRV